MPLETFLEFVQKYQRTGASPVKASLSEIAPPGKAARLPLRFETGYARFAGSHPEFLQHEEFWRIELEPQESRRIIAAILRKARKLNTALSIAQIGISIFYQTTQKPTRYFSVFLQ